MKAKTHINRQTPTSQACQDALFAGFPVSVLTLVRPETALLDMICRRLELVVNSSESPDRVHVTCETLRPGEHKKQAVRLFAAALSLANSRRPPTGVLYEFSQLHANLASATGQSTASLSTEGRARSLGWRTSYVRIAVPTLWHLRQAGFELQNSDSFFDVSADELRTLLARLVSEVACLESCAGAGS